MAAKGEAGGDLASAAAAGSAAAAPGALARRLEGTWLATCAVGVCAVGVGATDSLAARLEPRKPAGILILREGAVARADVAAAADAAAALLPPSPVKRGSLLLRDACCGAAAWESGAGYRLEAEVLRLLGTAVTWRSVCAGVAGHYVDMADIGWEWQSQLLRSFTRS